MAEPDPRAGRLAVGDPGDTSRTQARLRQEPGGGFRLEGDLDFGDVPGLIEEGRRRFQGQDRLWIDLSGVGHVNSAGLALLFEWLEQARREGRELRIFHLPPALEAIARLSDALDLLPLGAPPRVGPEYG